MRKETILRFTEDESVDPEVRRAAENAENAELSADKADEAVSRSPKQSKPPKQTKLILEKDKSSALGVKLRFGKKDNSAEKLKDRGNRFTRSKAQLKGTAGMKTVAGAAVSGTIHRQVSNANEDGNIGVEAVDKSTEFAEVGGYAIGHGGYGRKLKTYSRKLKPYTRKLKTYIRAKNQQAKTDAANVNAIYQQRMAEDPESFSNPISRMQQKLAIRREYAMARRTAYATGAGNSALAGSAAGNNAAGSNLVSTITQRLSELRDSAFRYVTGHPQILLILAAASAVILVVTSSMSSCSTFLPGGSSAVVASSFTANDEDIVGANNDYRALEAALQEKIDDMERSHPGYDEYNYDVDEIGHDPYQLAAYLTVLYEDYTRDEVQSTLRTLFNAQYDLDIEERTEIRYRTETHTETITATDPVTGEVTETEQEVEEQVPYEYKILNVTLRNNNLGHIITESGGMTEDQASRYALLLETKGNKPDLFADDPYVATSSDYLDYDIPGEALSDVKFANMIHEAEKYLGYPYVWGGSSPSTSFDCSGFVSYVINHCGNGWSIGRKTANGLKNYCRIIPASEAKPGDLIFFQGTYNTKGASHVGIYVGNGMMIHCGNPISYASVNSAYFRKHFYCYGRIPD